MSNDTACVTVFLIALPRFSKSNNENKNKNKNLKNVG